MGCCGAKNSVEVKNTEKKKKKKKKRKKKRKKKKCMNK